MAPARSSRAALDALRGHLEAVVAARLRALIVYEAHGMLGDLPGGHGQTDAAAHAELVHTLAIIDRLSADDLARLAPLSVTWQRLGLAVPLLLAPGDLRRSLDAFALEFSQIMARHEVIVGEDPFAGLSVAATDLRRACETQVRSHLLHLREGYLETAGQPQRIGELMAASVPPLRALLVNLARLHGVEAHHPHDLEQFVGERLHLPLEGLHPLLSAPSAAHVRDLDAAGLFPAYLRAVEGLAALVDEWTR